ncbi:MAG: hypothetical protein QXH51_06840 [Candidatus Bathyarchaeia archaeon]
MEVKRKYTQVHEMYLVEWLGLNYPPGTWRTNVRLGDKLIAFPAEGLTEEERRLRLAFAASVDAVVLLPKEVHLVEAMVRHEPGVMEDLLAYKELFPYTTGFEPYKDLPIKLILVTPLELGWKGRFYMKYGIHIVHYSPTWILQYLHTYPRKEWRGKLSAL